MTRTQAVARILREIGFRPAGTTLDDTIISALQEAQRELENGKTLPRSLMVDWAVETVNPPLSYIELPTGFIRESEMPPRYFANNSGSLPVNLKRVSYVEAEEILAGDGRLTTDISFTDLTPAPPQFYTISPGSTSTLIMDFYIPVDQPYDIYFGYFKRGQKLISDIENEWLDEDRGAPDWLIGEAGYRIAKSLRDTTAMQSFDDMRKTGRASVLAGIIAAELGEADEPLQMGMNL